MRISDWSSDVCSSDLVTRRVDGQARRLVEDDGLAIDEQNSVMKQGQGAFFRKCRAAIDARAASYRAWRAWRTGGMRRIRRAEGGWNGSMSRAEIGRASCRERGCQCV